MKYKNFQKSRKCLKFLCYNKTMLKTKTRVNIAFVAVLSIAAGVQAGNFVANQATAANTTFEVNVVENLTVSVTSPQTGAVGNINTFLRNDINVSVISNNTAGFTASMYSKDTTDLTNTAKSTATIPTISSGTTYTCSTAACTEFGTNVWGYSTNDASHTGTYSPMVSTSSSPINLITAASGTTSASQDVYFGAKADVTKASGTYIGTVIISVVGGAIENDNTDPDYNPVTPVNPAVDNDTNGTNPSYATNYGNNGDEGWTTYTTTSTSGSGSSATNTTTTQVSGGDTRNSYSNPAGVTENTVASINDNTPVATGLAVASTVAATSGMFFFILAKRRGDDEDEEEESA